MRDAIKSSKFLISEVFLAIYLVAFVTLDASKSYTHIDNYLALLFMMATVMELGSHGLMGVKSFRFVLPMVGVLLLSWLTLILNLDGMETQVSYTLNVLLFLCVFALIRTTHRTWPIEIAFAIGVLIIWKTQGANFAEFKKFKGDRLEFNLGDESGLNANLYGFYLILTLFYTIKFLFVDSVIGKKSLYWWGRFTLMIPASIVSIQQIVFVTGSRKAQLMMVAALIAGYVIFVTGSKDRRIAKVVIGGIASIVAVAFLWFELRESDHFTRIEAMFDMVRFGDTQEESAEGRMIMVHKAVDMWLESPIIGQGTGAFATKSGFEHYCHNGYLEILSAYGIVGFIMYYWVMIKSLIITFQWRRSRFISVSKHGVWLFTMLLCTAVLFEPFAVTYTEGSTAVYLGCVFGIVSFMGSKMKLKGC